MSDQVKDAELTEEQIAERREKITEFYNSHIPHLKVQSEYEELLTKIEENRARRLQAQVMIAQMYSNQNESAEATQTREDFEQELQNQRKLKTT